MISYTTSSHNKYKCVIDILPCMMKKEEETGVALWRRMIAIINFPILMAVGVPSITHAAHLQYLFEVAVLRKRKVY